MKKKFVFLLILIILLGITLFIFNYNKKQNEKKRIVAEKNLLEDIDSHYNKFVKTSKETILYKYESGKYIEFGKINKDINLIIEENSKENKKSGYFYITDLDLYINYKDVTPIDIFENSDRYKNYIVFNENIITNKTTIFYDENNNYIFEINKSFDLPIIIKDDDKYGVEFYNQLMYVNSKDVDKTCDNENTNEHVKEKIRVLTYHFLYDQDTETCDQIICQSFKQLEEEFNYLRENDYFTLKLNELELYMDGKIQIPEKSIVITIDDGTIFNNDAIKILEKYKVNATIFVITSINENFDYLRSDYLDVESHTHNMHNQYECPGYGTQGAGILCLDEDYILNDLKKSQEILGGSLYIAYPLFDYNDRAIELLKKAGFHMAFVGEENTGGYSYPEVTNKYTIRRKTIFSSTTLDEFISIVK